jgi:hypothetical protein
MFELIVLLMSAVPFALGLYVLRLLDRHQGDDPDDLPPPDPGPPPPVSPSPSDRYRSMDDRTHDRPPRDRRHPHVRHRSPSTLRR